MACPVTLPIRSPRSIGTTIFVASEVPICLSASRYCNRIVFGSTVCATSKIFMQVLEGGRGAVSALYNRIAQDPRHRDIALLSYEEIGERSFSGWSMGQVSMNRLNPALLLKYSESAVLDPYSVSGKASLALFNELVATASVVCLG